jgi:hypothetical protein
MLRTSRLLPGLLVASAAILTTSAAAAAPITFSSGGAAATVVTALDDFRAGIGGINNGNVPGPVGSGRREINWDGGGGVSATASAGTPFIGFTNNRGATFETDGTGFLQATPQGLADTILEPTYAAEFEAFSPLRLFTPVGGNITDVTFSIPGTAGATPAVVNAFGAIFNGVDLSDTTSLAFFDPLDNPLGLFFVPTGQFSFLGVHFNAGEQIARVRITTGTNALGAGVLDNPAGGVDLVAMDDFVFQEPFATPEPASLVLTGLGLTVLAVFGRRLRR